MKAKIIKPNQFNAQQPASSKEVVNTLTVLTVVKGEIKELAVARFYMSRSAQASVVYCCLWLHGDKGASGKGSTGGWGYHKESAALQEAINSAGIELYGTPYKAGTQRTESHWNNTTGTTVETPIDYKRVVHIGGCGSTAMEDALTDICRDVLGYKKVKVVVS
jgi:hypothetical protein